MTDYNPKNPDLFRQVEIKEPTPPELNIVALSNSVSTVKKGDFQSKNFRSGRSGYRLREDGTLEARNGIFSGTFTLGNIVKTVTSADNIQKTIDEVYASGGGSVYLSPGIYNMSSDINLYSGISLVGTSATDTIIDFGGGAYSVKVIGTDDYGTGTVTIANGDTTVTGNGTTWTDDMVGQYIFMGNWLYEIATFVDVDEITLTGPYDGPDLTNDYYKIATPQFNTTIESLAIQNSSSYALYAQYAMTLFLQNIEIYDSADGLYCVDVVALTVGGTGIEVGNNGTNIFLQYCPSFTLQTSVTYGATTDYGVYLENSNDGTLFNFGVYSNNTDGIHIKNCNKIAFLSYTSDSNGGQGIELEAGCEDLQFIGGTCSNNTSDGLKLTATSDRNSIVACSFNDNGGYGINIATSSSDNNQILSPAFSGNTSGNIYDLGTNTIVLPESLYENYTIGYGNSTTAEDLYGWVLGGTPSFELEFVRLGAGEGITRPLLLDLATASFMLFSNTKKKIIKWSAKIINDTTNANAFMGLIQNGSTGVDAPTFNRKGCGFYIDAVGDWYCYTGNGANNTATAISKPSASKHMFRLDISTVAVSFIIDDTTVATNTTYLPNDGTQIDLSFTNDTNSTIIDTISPIYLSLQK